MTRYGGGGARTPGTRRAALGPDGPSRGAAPQDRPAEGAHRMTDASPECTTRQGAVRGRTEHGITA
ncbi:hypothetical protein OKJ48_08410, partial [Streptomyces kunmingensis]